MKHVRIIALLASTLTTTPALAQNNHVAVLVDGSGSYGMMHDDGFAQRVVQDLVDRLPTFSMRDLVTVMPIGDYAYDNPVKEVRVSKKFPPARAKPALSGLLMGFPESVRKRGEPQSTNIIGALNKLSRRMDCTRSQGLVFILSDGAETGQSMTLPSHEHFAGCLSFTMIGVTGRTPQETQELGAFWMRWCEAAGFARCGWLS